MKCTLDERIAKNMVEEALLDDSAFGPIISLEGRTSMMVSVGTLDDKSC